MRTAKALIILSGCVGWAGLSLSVNRIIGYNRIYEWKAKPGWYLPHAQDDVNPHILRMLEGIFTLEAAHVCVQRTWSEYAATQGWYGTSLFVCTATTHLRFARPTDKTSISFRLWSNLYATTVLLFYFFWKHIVWCIKIVSASQIEGNWYINKGINSV